MRMRMPVTRMGRLRSAAFLVSAVLLIFAQHPAASPQKNHQEFDRLAQKALADGTVGVIIHLDVPAIVALTAASASYSAPDMGRAMVQQREDADAALKAAITEVSGKVVRALDGTTFTINHAYVTIPFLALRVGAEGLGVLRDSELVIGIEEDEAVQLVPPERGTAGPTANETDVPSLDVSTANIGAQTVWGWGYTGAGWYVAILDTGIRSTHQFFTGKTIVEACFALGSDGLSGAGDCPNGRATQTGAGSAAHYSSAYTGYDHGTHVSGIAAGNYGALAGVAKGADIVAVQVFSKFSAADCSAANPCVSSYNSDSLAGLEYIYSIRGSYRIAAVNMSLGGSTKYTSACDSDSRTSIITNLRSAGIATAIATGNSDWCGGISAPACISTSVAVGASTDSDGETSFNNWHGTMQKLFAPGYQINSSTGGSDSSYASWNGTSMATPHVTGVWALMKQVVANGSVTDFLTALQNQGVSIKSACDNYSVGISRIRVDRAISALAHTTLVLQSSAFGTTDPAPGTYGYATGSTVTITATPATYSAFTGWTGNASGTTNPVTVTMDASKTIMANFRYVYAPSVAGSKVTNRSFSQVEIIHVIKFGSNPANDGLTISYYRVYQVDGSTLTKLADVNASTDTYQHRQAGTAAITYAVVAVTNNGYEGAPATVTVQ
jgi:subtilisin family serine protease